MSDHAAPPFAANPARSVRDSGTNLPTVSVVMPTYERPELARQAALALLNDNALTEIVIVDDGSSNSSVAQMASLASEDPRVKVVVLDKNRGRSVARNLGLQAASGEVVLFVDDDVVAAPQLAAGHASHHLSATDLVVVGYMPVDVAFAKSAFSLIYADEYQGAVDAYGEDPEVILQKLWGGNVSLRRDRALVVQLVSEGVSESYHEDQDFGLRCRAVGMRGVFDDQLKAHHLHTRDLKGFLNDARNRGEASVLMRQKHGAEFGTSPTLTTAILGRRSMGRAAELVLGPATRKTNWLGITAAKILRRLAFYQGVDRSRQIGSRR